MDAQSPSLNQLPDGIHLQVYQFASILDLMAIGVTNRRFADLVSKAFKTIKHVDLRLPDIEKAIKYEDDIREFMVAKFGDLEEVVLNREPDHEWLYEGLWENYTEMFPYVMSMWEGRYDPKGNEESSELPGVLIASSLKEVHDSCVIKRRDTMFIKHESLNQFEHIFDMFKFQASKVTSCLEEDLELVKTLIIKNIRLVEESELKAFEKLLYMMPSLDLLKLEFNTLLDRGSEISGKGAKKLTDIVKKFSIRLEIEFGWSSIKQTVCKKLAPYATSLYVCHHNQIGSLAGYLAPDICKLPKLRKLESTINKFAALMRKKGSFLTDKKYTISELAVNSISKDKHFDTLLRFVSDRGNQLINLELSCFETEKLNLGPLLNVMTTSCYALEHFDFRMRSLKCQESTVALRDFIRHRGGLLKTLKIDSTIAHVDILSDVIERCKKLEILQIYLLKPKDFQDTDKILKNLVSALKLYRADIRIYDATSVDDELVVDDSMRFISVVYVNGRVSKRSGI